MGDVLRNIVFRFESSLAFARALRQGGQELGLPPDEEVADGEWVLAIFEIGAARRATASAARGLLRGPPSPPVVVFDRRDWDRLSDFADAGSGRRIVAAPAVPLSPPPPDPLGGSESAPPSSLAGTSAWPSPQAPNDKGSAPAARVLVVDDDRAVHGVVTTILDAAGIDVHGVRSGEEALERIRVHGCDLVVLDWTLPGMTGIELCQAIRSDPARGAMPILFLSARAATQDVVDAFASGADDYVTKPFRVPELGARIANLLRRLRRMSASP